MSNPVWLKKYLTMKPEVKKIFNDLEEWHNHCRMNMTKFDPKDLYKSREYKEFAKDKKVV
jgi:hypothetical protein